MTMESCLNINRAALCFREMERNGVYLDVPLCGEIATAARAEETALLTDLRAWFWEEGWVDQGDMPGYDVDDVWSSGPRLQTFLHTPLGLNVAPSRFWKKGQVKPGEIKVDEMCLQVLAGLHPQHRENLDKLNRLRKVRGTLKYAEKLPKFVHTDGLIHPIFGPASDADDRVGAVTGRGACKRPELTQIPSDKKKDKYSLRRVFNAGPAENDEVLVVVDLSAAEVVFLAQILVWLFDDTGLAERISGKVDIHTLTAHFMFSRLGFAPAASSTLEEYAALYAAGDKEVVWQRGQAKNIRYGIVYGKREYGFGNTMFMANGDSLGEERAKAMLDAFFLLEPGILKYEEWVTATVKKHGGICSPDGRWCDLRWLTETGDEWQVKRAVRKALNFPMQAGVAGAMLEAMWGVTTDPRLKALGARLTLQVHDELIIRVARRHAQEALDIVKGHMQSSVKRMPRPFDVPMGSSGHFANNWHEAK